MCVAPFDDLDGVPEVERQHELARRGFAYATDHPSYVAQVLLHNSLRLLNLEGSNWWRYEAEMLSLPRWPADVAAYAFYVLLAAALTGALTPAARRGTALALGSAAAAARRRHLRRQRDPLPRADRTVPRVARDACHDEATRIGAEPSRDSRSDLWVAACRATGANASIRGRARDPGCARCRVGTALGTADLGEPLRAVLHPIPDGRVWFLDTGERRALALMRLADWTQPVHREVLRG
jgi:hypothetical protein